MNLPTIPILTLYQTGYWKHGLTTMIQGIPVSELPQIKIAEYTEREHAKQIISEFLKPLNQKHN